MEVSEGTGFPPGVRCGAAAAAVFRHGLTDSAFPALASGLHSAAAAAKFLTRNRPDHPVRLSIHKKHKEKTWHS